MSSAYDKLRRILVLEREQGCRDRAVIGGLGRFLTYWAKEARGGKRLTARHRSRLTISCRRWTATSRWDTRARIQAVEGLVIGLFEASRTAGDRWRGGHAARL